MLLAVKTSRYVNAITDSYKSIINEFSDKENVIAIVPNVYKINEFSKDFKSLLKEEFSCHNKLIALFLAVKLTFKIRNLVKLHGIDKVFIYHENDWFNIFLYIFLAGLRVRYFIWMHDPILHSGEGRITKAVNWFNSKFVYKSDKLEKIIISYNGIKDFVSTNYKIDKKKIVSIKLPEIKEMEFEDIRSREEGIQNFKYDVIFFGRVEEYKGIGLFVDAVKYFKNHYGLSLKGIIVGTGRIENIISEKIIGSDNLTFINRYVSDVELAEYIVDSKVVILPYKDATGSITVQVANYYNKPVIASRAGCFPEYIKSGINGLLLDDYSEKGLADKMYELLFDEKTYNEVKSNIQVYFKENFEIGNMVRKLEEELGL